MKSMVIYFSQTGNTEKVAKAIQKGVKQTVGHCDIAKIKDANPRRLNEYDLIGLGSPVFGMEPGNVRAFINDMSFVGGKHIFAFSTHASLPDLYFSSIYPRLKDRGLVVIGMRGWYSSCNILSCPKPYPTDGHPDEIDLKEAGDFGREMVEHSRRISAGEIKLIPPAPPALSVLIPPGNPQHKNDLKALVKFRKEKCTYPECRLCMDNCPVNGIDLSLEPHVFMKPCIGCEFCTKICPTGAIDADAFTEKATPEFMNNMRTILLPNHLDKAEKEGHFRRLVPVEDIGWDTPLYKIHKKHPQWIIGKGLQ